MYLNLGLPSFANMRCTLLRLMDSGRPPQGKKKSLFTSGFKWNSLRKISPDSINCPF